MAADTSGLVSIGARLRAPRTRVPTVRRTPLLERLNASTQRLVLVSAPAGYGKTTLVCQWLEQQPLPSAWLRLESMHNDPVTLLAYLTDALSEVISIDEDLSCSLAAKHPPIEERVLPGLAAAADSARPFILALDDAHIVEAVAGWRYLELLFDALPQGARLVVASRSDPPLPLARLRATGEVVEFRTADLRMSHSEAAALLRLHGCNLDAEDLGALVGRTEGWATGLYLTLLAGDAAQADLRGDLHEIAAYLTSEVIDRQSQRMQEFLLRTSILDRMCASSCSAVTGLADAHLLLAELARDNLFVAPLDDHDEWFRYHHLFGELLRAQLLRRSSGETGDLHRRASAWYTAQDDLERAVSHAIAAGDGDNPRVADLAAIASDRLMNAGQFTRARLLFALFNDQQVRAHPVLLLTAGQLSMYTGDRRIMQLGRQSMTTPMPLDPSPVGVSSLHGWQTLLRAQRAPDGLVRMLEDAELACALEAHSDSGWLDTAEAMRAMALYLLGRVRRSLSAIAEALPRQRNDDSLAWWLGLRALIALDQDDGQLAESLDAEIQGLETTDVTVPPTLAHALVLARRADPDALGFLASAEHDLAEVFASTPWRHVLGADAFGEAALRLGDQAAAERWAAEAESVLETFVDAGILRGRTRRLREALEELRLGEPLTPAERRVLDLLPTQLTAGQMAARLFVTENTVKSHLRSIYRKLAVTHRTGAVEQARRLGLL